MGLVELVIRPQRPKVYDCLSATATAMWPFPSKRFPGDKLVGIGSIGIDASERIVAFGDFNGDQL
jgi:hypothetical protein